MASKLVFVLAAMLVNPIVAWAAEPYQAKVGDKQVTSVARPVTRGLGLGYEELLEAARTSHPLQIVPSNALPGSLRENAAPPNSSNDDSH